MTASSFSPRRREFLRGASVLAAGALAPLAVADKSAAKYRRAAADSFRFVFLPDIHRMRNRRSPQGMAACLSAVEKLDPKPAFLVTGGDLIDSLRQKEVKEAEALAELFLKIWNDHTKLPVYHCLGNHDPLGWGDVVLPRDHPQFGFKFLQQKLKMEKLFYSFDFGGWHFVILLNITLTEPGKYVSEFDDEQMAFLKADLAKNKERPTFVFGHFPPYPQSSSSMDGQRLPGRAGTSASIGCRRIRWRWSRPFKGPTSKPYSAVISIDSIAWKLPD
jgi:Icc protein